MPILAIDAGASKTRVIYSDREDYSDTREARFGVGNYRLIKREGIAQLCTQICDRFAIKNPENYKVFAGFAGASSQNTWENIKSVFIELGFKPGKVNITSDANLMLKCLKDQGILIIAGTGSICVGKNRNLTARAGGYGYRLGDKFSGYAIGIEAINAALRQEDKREHKKTALHQMIKEYFKLDDYLGIAGVLHPVEENVDVIGRVAALAPKVFELAKAGDVVANEIVANTILYMSDHILAVFHKLNDTVKDVGFFGGLFEGSLVCETVMRLINQNPKLNQYKFNYKLLTDEGDALIQAVKFWNFESE